MKAKRKASRESISVAQYDLQGNEIEVFESMTAAQAKTGVSAWSISKCVNGTGYSKSAGGFVWKAFELEID